MDNHKSPRSNNQVTPVVTIPGYKIIDVLGRGGMAIVYKAIQESVGRTVAIKVLAPNHADETFTERFLREAQIISNLTHPNIITVFDAGVVKSHHYMSMEYITGKTLRDARDDLSRKQKVAIIKQIALALDYASHKGYVHRDIKPENIMLHEDGRAVLMDFGIARGDDTVRGLTLTGKAIGTPYYMSPEQTKGIQVDTRSDIYSLGVVLYQALTGCVPYDGNSFVDVGMKHITEPIPTLPSGLESFQSIINKAMSKDPAHRYQTAGELINALNTVSLANLDYFDAKATVISNNSTDYDSPTVVDSAPQQSIVKPARNKLKGNVKPGLKIKSKTQYKRKTDPGTSDISQSDNFKSLKRRRRLLTLLLLSSLAAAVYYNQKKIEPYWLQYALPVLQQYLPAEIKDKIGLANLTVEPKKQQVTIVKKKLKIVSINNSNLLFTINNFIIPDQPKDASIKPIPDLELTALQVSINEHTQNASVLILYYKKLINSDASNTTGKIARDGIIQLRIWFEKQLKDSINNKDITHGKLLLSILKTNLPTIKQRTRFQSLENTFLQQESIKTHLRLAEEFFIKKQYIEPESENALEEVTAVLNVEPGNVHAKEIQLKMLDIFVAQVKKLQTSKHYESAIISAQSGLKISKNDAFLNSSLKNLKKLFNNQNKVDGYLLQAQKQMTKGNYVSPANNSAFKIYTSVFELDANNKVAEQSLKKIELKLVGQASQAIKSNNISNAKLILQLLEQYYPESPFIKKMQTSLAQAIAAKDPAVTKIVFSDVLLSSMEKMADIRIQSGKRIYVGIKFKNFPRQTSYLLVKLLDHTAVTKLLHKTIKLDESAGQQIFSIDIPGAGLKNGNYYIEIKHGKNSLIKKSFQILEP